MQLSSLIDLQVGKSARAVGALFALSCLITQLSPGPKLSEKQGKAGPTTPSVPETHTINMRDGGSCSGTLLPPPQSCLGAGRLGPWSLVGIRRVGFGRGLNTWGLGSGWP